MTFGLRELLDFAFVAFLAFTAVMTLVFYYHWGRYAPSTVSSIGIMVVYSVGAVILLLGMLGALSGV